MISSRIRLARNIKGIPFTGRMTVEQKKAVCTKVKEVASAIPGYKFDYIDMENVTAIQAGSMVEEHLISVEFANNREGEGLLLDRKHNVSVMINEEDHLRIQVLGRGEKLATLYETASEIDDALDEKLHFAFSEKLGYLTHCPTNLGTGLRASVMMHLPALHESGLINKIINTVSQVGLTVRGMYGEGSEPAGCVYQVSNQITLGISEKDTIERLEDIVRQIARNEAALREKMLENISIEDRVFRSYGIAREARIMSSQEFMKLMSDIRLGIEGGLLNLDTKVLDELCIKVQPYTLMLYGGEGMEIRQRDIKRAEIVRDKLKE
mgnify:FL=1